MDDAMSKEARIELREFKIGGEKLGINIGVASHLYWVLYDDENNIVGELHGTHC